MKKILLSGGNGKFARKLLEKNKDYIVYAPDRYDMDITNINSVKAILVNSNQIYFYATALTRMVDHVRRPSVSIRTT